MYPGTAPDASLRNRSASPAQLGTAHIGLVPGNDPVELMSARNGTNSQPLLQAGIPPSERAPNASRWARARARAHDLVEGSIDTWFEFTLLGVIFLNVVALLIGSVPVHHIANTPPWCDQSSPETQAPEVL
jgi:hypothetical protein